MTIGFLFWLFMILWLVFGVWQTWWQSPPAPGNPLVVHGGSLLVFLLFLLLGIQVFGWPIKS